MNKEFDHIEVCCIIEKIDANGIASIAQKRTQSALLIQAKSLEVQYQYLEAFQMNSESLHLLYCNHNQQGLSFFKYDDTLFQRSVGVYNYKDTLFIIFTDMANIQAVYKKNKLMFRYTISILIDLRHQILLQYEKGKKILKNEITVLQKEVNNLSNDLKRAYKAHNDANFGIQLKVAKRYRRSPFTQSAAAQAGASTTQTQSFELSKSSTSSEEIQAGLCSCLPKIMNIIRNAINRIRDTTSSSKNS
ncbi:hypothetical protein A0J61_09795 [Choanephora cucurbitarum]|uniref:Uncharacterized protein n=1 Tax=Choanephora cucurbitarum TaxID=101091 RepID=A0A1C7MZF6_9FUNG|nr:hypothetical protein A0J61_09795 [Choanephora cucurbitarum]